MALTQNYDAGPAAADPHQVGGALPAVAADRSDRAYPAEEWQAAYFAVDHRGVLVEQRVAVHVPAGLAGVCRPVAIGTPGCIYGVRRWGFIVRPSALEAAGFEPIMLPTESGDVSVMGAILRAAAYELPGEYVIASPEHPFRLVAHDGIMRGSSIRWRTYLGALAFFASGGEVDQAFIRLWAEARTSYHLAVDHCQAILKTTLHA